MASNVKILLVDDNPMVLGMLQQALSVLGEVTVATDAADALLKAVEDVPDVLICDYRMPGMDGRQLLEKLKSRPATAGIAVILLDRALRPRCAHLRQVVSRLRPRAGRRLRQCGGRRRLSAQRG